MRGAHVCHDTCQEVRGLFWRVSSLLLLWVLGTALRLSGLHDKSFYSLSYPIFIFCFIFYLISDFAEMVNEFTLKIHSC